MKDLPVILFDTNLGTFEGGYLLIFDQSLRDLEALGSQLADGLEVLIRMPGELEMRATLRHEHHPNISLHDGDAIWIGYPIPGTIVYLDGSELGDA